MSYGFNHPKGYDLCCIHTLPSARRKELQAGLLSVVVDPAMPADTVEIRQDGKLVGAIINIGEEQGRDG